MLPECFSFGFLYVKTSEDYLTPLLTFSKDLRDTVAWRRKEAILLREIVKVVFIVHLIKDTEMFLIQFFPYDKDTEWFLKIFFSI